MKIYSKILLIILPLILVGLLVVGGVTYYLAQDALKNLAEQWLATKLADAMRIAQDDHSVLVKFGLERTAPNVKKAQQNAARLMSRIAIGKSGFVIAVDTAGNIVAHPHGKLIGVNVSGLDWFAQMGRRTQGRLDFAWHGERLLAVYHHFEPWGWYVLAGAPQKEIYGSVYRMRAYVLALGLFGLFALALALILLARVLTRPLHTLVREAERIGRGEFDARVTVGSRDEIGLLAVAIDNMKVQLKKLYDGLQQRIAEREQAERSLRESEERYRAIFNNAGVGIVLLDGEGRFVQVNRAFSRMLGYSEEELRKLSPVNVTHPEELQATEGLLRSLLQESVRFGRMEKRYLRKDGSVVWADVSMAALGDSEGLSQAAVGVIADITERKHLEEQLLHASKMEAIGQLAGGVAHDFNNLLTAMMGYSNLLLQEVPKDSPHREKILQITSASERAAWLTRQLLAFSRKQVLDVKVLDLNAVVADFESILRRLIGEDIELTTEFKAHPATVNADRGQIEQILLNLVVNARDAMPKGGSLAIETSEGNLDENLAESLSDVQPGPQVVLTVRDTGNGMDRETLGRIFEPFFTTKPKDTGTGLGLSMVYGIVKQHRGHVTAESEPGRGTVFRAYFPRVDAPLEKVDSQPSGWDELAGKETILLVEDEEVVRNLTSEVLEMHGYHVLKASSPAEAQRICDEFPERIDLLVSDVILPQMDGRSLFRLLAERRSDLRVLYVSGYTEDFIVHHGVLDRNVHFLPKPFTAIKLARKVREVLMSSAGG